MLGWISGQFSSLILNFIYYTDFSLLLETLSNFDQDSMNTRGYMICEHLSMYEISEKERNDVYDSIIQLVNCDV